ncbi:DUF1801 domain-containing protein [Nocardioides cavernaquae]|uniref:DUF1801 domain-containing protein n=1 Tax=Nocardioides cavernaquae TaxID=2321396 RepID=A0A3A5HH42_9ACTN|nr:DUF1801 domain-containing protein [Nocardioides cavernaquae]RJS47394.1 DUF1801 domain-containing protein [Nocardioides cavernaquae]
MTEVDAYLEGLPPVTAAVIRGYYDRARELVPEAEDGSKYAMACLTYRGRGLISVIRTEAGFSMFPFGSEPVALARPLLGGLPTTRGGVQFTADRLVPDAAYVLMVEWSRNHIDAALARRR